MKRTAYKNLTAWKERKDRRPLIVRGARQVGKTWLLKEFARNEFKSSVYISLDKSRELHGIFEGSLDPSRILMNIGAATGKTIKRGETLVILDEIQAAPRAIESLKYFCEDMPEQPIAVAGSLLGILLRGGGPEGVSFPVGKTESLEIGPMTFAEYVAAAGSEQLADLIETGAVADLEPLSDVLSSLLLEYFFTGGMPAVVDTFLRSGKQPVPARAEQNRILHDYEDDIAKHAGRETLRIQMVLRSLPSQLAKENRKFVYGAVRKGARAKDFEIAIQWLQDAGLATKLICSRTLKEPLAFYDDLDAFKLFFLDCGLLGALSGARPEQMLITGNVFEEFGGAFAEQFVLQQLKRIDPPVEVRYYAKADSQQEIDFIVQGRDGLIPVEVKRGRNVNGASMRALHADYPQLKCARLSTLPYKQQDWMVNIPLWLSGRLLDLMIPEWR